MGLFLRWTSFQDALLFQMSSFRDGLLFEITLQISRIGLLFKMNTVNIEINIYKTMDKTKPHIFQPRIILKMSNTQEKHESHFLLS